MYFLAPKLVRSANAMKRTLLLLLVCVFLQLGMVVAQDAPMQEIGEGEGQVDIIAWAGYIERGDTDPAFDWVTDFEEATGCMVNVKTAATSDEMVTLMNEGSF